MKIDTHEQWRNRKLNEANSKGWIIRLRADKDGYTVIHPKGFGVAGGSKENCEEYILNTL